MLNTFLPITMEHLSYLTQVIKIWILEYPIQAVFDLSLKNTVYCPVKSKWALKAGTSVGEYEQTEAKFSIPIKAESALRWSPIKGTQDWDFIWLRF